MCRGSLLIRNQEEAAVNQEYQVSSGADVGLRVGVLHRPGQGLNNRSEIRCAACIKQESRISIVGVPKRLQSTLNIDERFEATFVPALPHEEHDFVVLANGRRIALFEFVDANIRVSLVEVATQGAPQAAARVLEDA